MNFKGENEMILNPETVKVALEDWLNRQRVANLLSVRSVKQRKDGSISIRFIPEKEIARSVRSLEERQPNSTRPNVGSNPTGRAISE